MGKPTIYIDGQEGTTGLRIREMLAPREDVEVLLIPATQRKDPQIRAEFLNRADLCVLCLPDDAAAEALTMIENRATKVIDTSTTRRIDPEWVYGLPEISNEHKEQIRQARRVANCGCYPVGFTLAVDENPPLLIDPPNSLLRPGEQFGFGSYWWLQLTVGNRMQTTPGQYPAVSIRPHDDFLRRLDGYLLQHAAIGRKLSHTVQGSVSCPESVSLIIINNSYWSGQTRNDG